MQYKYNPKDHVDYIRDCLRQFHQYHMEHNIALMRAMWDRLYFDTKQALKERRMTSAEREGMLDYYAELISHA